MIVAVEYEFVPEATERRLAARPAHREWLTVLKADGRLVQAGPFADGRSALLIFDVEDDATLDGLLAADPYPKDSYAVASRIRRTRMPSPRAARGRRCSTSRTECPRRETTDQIGVGADSLS
jgi:uncharacterized protein YciI